MFKERNSIPNLSHKMKFSSSFDKGIDVEQFQKLSLALIEVSQFFSRNWVEGQDSWNSGYEIILSGTHRLDKNNPSLLVSREEKDYKILFQILMLPYSWKSFVCFNLPFCVGLGSLNIFEGQ